MKRLASLILLLVSLGAAQEKSAPRKPDLSTIIGKTVVLCRGAEVLSPLRTSDGKLDWDASQPHVSFMPFMAAKISEAQLHSFGSGSYTVPVLMTLADGKQGILVTEINEIHADEQGRELLFWAFLGPVASGDLLLDLPAGLKDGDVVTVQRGMKENVARCLLGKPDDINDYGRAGKQLVFNGGRLILYVDAKQDTVSEIQSLDRH